jgi:predicted ATP-grasp superfamily ATP-dependent carboligase
VPARRIFVWECLTATSGLPGSAAPAELAHEGRAMLQALTSDFADVAGLEVITLHSAAVGRLDVSKAQVIAVGNLDDEQRRFDRLVAAADWTVVIAPEIAGELLARCERVISLGGRLLGPSPQFVALAGDKHLTAEHLIAGGIRAPRGIAISSDDSRLSSFPFPAVLKPRDGAGSNQVRLLANAREVEDAVRDISRPGRLEEYCPGLPISVATLCGPAECFTLPMCRQHLSGDGRFAYLGGSLRTSSAGNDAQLSDRAARLTRRAIAALPPALGYVGIDLVLGAAPDGSQDYVIEVNPRLTTSYVGLRALADCNLAEAMLMIAEGQTPRIAFRPGSIGFTPEGEIVESSA